MFCSVNVRIVRNYLCQLMVVLSLLSCSYQQIETYQHSPVSSSLSFYEKLFLLQQGDISSLTIDAIFAVDIKVLSHDNRLALIDDISAYDNGVLFLNDFGPITAQDVIKLDDNIGLFYLSDPLSSDVWVISVSSTSDPIEALLVSRQFGNNEYRVKRDYTHQLNKTLNKFEIVLTIEDSRWDTDWIEYPTKGVRSLTHQKYYEIVVTKEGRFRVKE